VNEIARRRDQPPVIEGPGRYTVFRGPDGGWVVARAVDICETCRGCGCGTQADPIQVPFIAISLAGRMGMGQLMGALKGLAGRG
jgi:hypothetical protein